MNKKFDLKDRTYDFAVNIVKFCIVMLRSRELKDIGRQLLRSGTSIGANVEEADGARTRKEFGNKMSISRNEAKETRYWLRLILDSGILNNKENIEKARVLTRESDELVRILSSIVIKTKAVQLDEV